MAGKLIFVSGLSGAGKTTLVRAALETIPALIYIRTTTTRPLRDGETNGEEYRFVSDSEYEALRATYPDWDHTDYGGYKYGADTHIVTAGLAKGTDFICAIAPGLSIIDSMQQLYGVTAVTVWIDVPAELAKSRIADDAIRSQRQEDSTTKQHFGHVFTPSGKLSRDKADFVVLLQKILQI